MTAAAEFRYESRDGLSLFSRLYGQREANAAPVVCLPGITRNSRDFEDLALHLAAQRFVVTPDFRGRGHSDADPDWRNYHPQTYVGDVVELLDALDIESAVFVGTSLGGLVSMALNARHGGRVAGVILNDVGPEIGAEGLARIKDYIGRAPPVANWDEAVLQLRGTYEIAWPDLSEADWYRLVRRSYSEADDGRPVLDLDPAVGDAAREVGTNLDDPWALFDALRGTPTLLLHGESSDILTDEIAARMRERLPELIYVRVPGRGHVPLLDEAVCIEAIDGFLVRIG